MRKPFLYCGLVTILAFAAHAQELPSDIDRVRQLVEAGAAPRSALDKLQAEQRDRDDDQVLRRTLYGTLSVEDITPEQTAEMLGAAERRVARKRGRVEELKTLVEEGVLARSMLAPALEDLKEREETLALARSRAQFLDELAAMARREQELAQLEQSEEPSEARPVRERFDGNGVFTRDHLKSVVLAFEKEFSRPLPVSAHGDTAFHRALGFDHRGRVDVALNPDEPEGAWLRQFLASEGIPFYAFRSFVPGAASGAHIHIGPPSMRLKTAD